MHAYHIAIGYIQPGKSDQNAFIERFNRSFREEVLDAHLFDALENVPPRLDVECEFAYGEPGDFTEAPCGTTSADGTVHTTVRGFLPNSFSGVCWVRSLS